MSENDGWFEFDMPVSKVNESECPVCIYEAVGVKPKEVYFDNDYLIVLDDEDLIKSLIPDFTKFQELTERGTILTAKSNEPGIDFVSRWFGGKGIGIDEDPVTGSAHCLLTPYWSKKLNKENLIAKQISPRGGNLLCSMSGDRVKVSGKACIYLKAEIYL